MDWLHVTMPISGVDIFWPGLVILGLGVGVIGGFFGMGGAWMVTPGLNILGFPMTFAIGTGVMQVAGVSVVGTMRHAKLGNVDARMGAVMAVGTMIGLRIGASVVMWLERIGLVEAGISLMYVVLLALVAWLILSDIRKAGRKGTGDGADEGNGIQWYKAFQQIPLPPVMDFKWAGVRCSVWLPVGVGLVIGVTAGLLGIGGGLIALPALIYLVGCSAHVAVGTSLFTIMISGMYGAYTYARFGRAELLAAIIMLTGASFGAHIGATATKYVKGSGIKYAFAGGVIGCAISVVLKQIGAWFPSQDALLNLCSLVLILGLVFGLCVYIILCMALGMRKGTAPEG
ncbi:MAG: sulfite exporter TauE/SafE family protein [Planctomycetota bacterium]